MKTNQPASRKHSNLPWHIEDSEVFKSKKDILSSTDNAVCDGLHPDNAEFIVKATSNFYPLLEACKEARSLLNLGGLEYLQRNIDSVVVKLASAINDAEGEES